MCCKDIVIRKSEFVAKTKFQPLPVMTNTNYKIFLWKKALNTILNKDTEYLSPLDVWLIRHSFQKSFQNETNFYQLGQLYFFRGSLSYVWDSDSPELDTKRIEYISEGNLENPSVWIFQSLSAWKGVQSVQIM